MPREIKSGGRHPAAAPGRDDLFMRRKTNVMANNSHTPTL
jgi:hypothetical protein